MLADSGDAVQQDITRFFGVVLETMKRDLGVAIKGLATILAALGLVVYTEMLGAFLTGDIGPGTGRSNFDAAFRELGPAYADAARRLKETENAEMYDALRSGLVHQYLAKVPITFYPEWAGEPRPTGGVFFDEGKLVLVADIYLRDFAQLAERIRINANQSESVRKAMVRLRGIHGRS